MALTLPLSVTMTQPWKKRFVNAPLRAGRPKRVLGVYVQLEY